MLRVNVRESILNVSLLPRKLSKNILWHVLKKYKRWKTFYAAKVGVGSTFDPHK